ncbi:hypothetical protein GYMLUDRAFT_264151 [Collybiopsis luxurians FD-317 M1]|uniref:Unplaced genomic scaffold GYMLUscaffold_59, whole genome shotgun sequence n=1 Tax=Collybiopsis luxurians FD-317 M1 TaxID=944289 RepID=A0A0D0BZF2_9AGAR|nr:hypothetical protein GYMLUDRAFT_264151 [Collybiopsis luxurians FD-317 M1]
MTVCLPFEIWWKILEYLPSDTYVIRLRTVNRVFLEIARMLLYRKLRINRYEENRTTNFLQGINSLSLGHYVHSLHLQPWTVASTSHHRRPVRRFLSAFDHVYSFFDSHYAMRRVEKRVHKQLQLVTDTVAKLEFVRECTIDGEIERPYYAQLFTAFLNLLSISSFSQTITILTLKVPTDQLICLGPAHLPALEELDIYFATSTLSEKYIDGCLEHVIGFLNKHLQTLCSLSISSSDRSCNLNLSKFFHLLSVAYFPRLCSFSLNIPYDGSHLPNATEGAKKLQSFIFKHSRNLHHLKLSTSIRSHFIQSRSYNLLWIQRTLTSPHLANAFNLLKSLELSFRCMESNVGPLLKFISSVAHQLESLSLISGFLTPEDLGMVVDILAPAPASPSAASTSSLLHLNVGLLCLSPSTFDLLASRLPSLKSLAIAFYDIKSSPRPQEDWRRFPGENLRYDSMMFRNELSYRTYPQWNLSSLTLYAPSELAWGLGGLRKIITECFPLVVDFNFSFGRCLDHFDFATRL